MATPQGGDVELMFAPVDPALAVDKGDLVALADNGTVKKASDASFWDTNLATSQPLFVAKFFGVASQTKKADQDIPSNAGVNSGKIRLANGGRFIYAAAAGTYVAGVTLVGPAKQSGSALENQKVAVVTDIANAIGIVVRHVGTAAASVVDPATVEVKLLSKRLPEAR